MSVPAENDRYGVTAQSRRRPLGTANAVSEYTQLPKSTVYDLARAGSLPGVVRVGRRLRFDMDRIEAWVDAGGNRNSVDVGGGQ